MKTYKDFVIMTDMDGTLIGSNHEVSAENKAAIKYFTEQGGSFGVATGRTQKNCVKYTEGLAINAPCIFYNGGALFDWQKKEFVKTLPLENAKLLAFVKECIAVFPEICVQVYTQDTIYIVSNVDNHDQVMLKEKQEFSHATMEEVQDLPWIKILFCDDKDTLLQCRELAEKYRLGEITHNFFSSPFYLEFVEKHVSKGNMLSTLKGLKAYQGKTFVAAGDFDNDIEMLQEADFGIAPANAQPSVKAVADLVTVSHDENLLAHIINEVIPKMFDKA